MIQTRRSSQGRRERQKAKGRHVRTQRRNLQAERLEGRQMLAGNVNPWHNIADPLDVNDDTSLTPLDALIVVNNLNQYGAGRLGQSLAAIVHSGSAEGEASLAASGSSAILAPEAKVDVDDDNYLTPIDALRVINALNAGEGETTMVRASVRMTTNVPARADRIPVLDYVPASPPAGYQSRQDIVTVNPYNTIMLNVFVEDTRKYDGIVNNPNNLDPPPPEDANGDGVDDTDEFGIFAAYFDVTYDADAFTVPPGASSHPKKTDPNFPISFVNPKHQQFFGDIETERYNFRNGPSWDGSTPGLIDEAGSFADLGSSLRGRVKPGVPADQLDVFLVGHLFDVPFTVESFTVGNDTFPVEEGKSATLAVTNNDLMIGSPAGVSYAFGINGAESPGNAVLAYGNTGYGSGSQTTGSVVPAAQIDFVNDAVTVVNNRTLTVSISTPPTKGSVALGADQKSFVYTPAVQGPATDTFVYNAFDGVSSKQATVTVNIGSANDAPVITIPAAQTTNEDTGKTLAAGAISVADADAGNGQLLVTVNVPNGTGSFSLGNPASGIGFTVGDGTRDTQMTFTGTLTQINNAFGAATFHPALNYNGSATVVITVNDQGNTGDVGGAKSDTKTLAINVTALNDAPVNTVPIATQVAIEFTPMTFTPSISTTDVEALAETKPVQVNLSVTKGKLTLGTQTGLTDVTGLNSAAVSFRGTLVNVNNALATLTYQANAFPQTDTLTMTTSDLGTSPMPVETDTDLVPISVQPSTKPAAVPDNFSVDEGSGAHVFDVLANDINLAGVVGGGDLKITEVTQGSAGGVVVNNGANVTYTRNGDYFGTETFTYKAGDATDPNAGNGPSETTVFVTVNGINDSPVITTAPTGVTTVEDTALPFSGVNQVSVADVDADAGGGLKVMLSVSHGKLNAPNGAVTISGANTGSLTISGLVAAVNASLGGLTYTPNKDFAGADTLNVTVDDMGHTGGGASQPDTRAIPITVTPVNDAPTIKAPVQVSTKQDVNLVFTAGTASEISVNDVDSAQVTVGLTLANGAQAPGILIASTPAGVTVTGNNSASVTITGSVAGVNDAIDALVFDPSAGYEGTPTLTVTATDGQLPAPNATVGIIVSGINDPPVNLLPQGPVQVAEDSDLFFNGNLQVSDPDAGVSQVEVTLSATRGTLTPVPTPGVTVSQGSIKLTGSIANINLALNGLKYRPDQDYNGPAQLVITTNDKGNTGDPPAPGQTELMDTDTIAITVTPVNDPPVANDDGSPTNRTTVLWNTADNSFDVLANDSTGPDTGETLTITNVDTTNAHGTVTIQNGKLLYTPTAGYTGDAEIVYTVNDLVGGAGLTDTATVYVTVVDFVPSDVSGYVYFDANDDGKKDPGEWGIGGVLVTLTGTNIQGNPENRSALTNEAGMYKFTKVMPSNTGTKYTLTEFHPAALVDGKDTAGDQGAEMSANDQMKIELPLFGYAAGIEGSGNNFGERGFRAEFAGQGLHDLVHSGPNGRGLLFGTDLAGNLQWYLNLGGWEGYIPGVQVSPSRFNAAVDNGKLSLTRGEAEHEIDATDVAIRSMFSRAGGLVTSILGGADDFGLPMPLAAAGGEGEGGSLSDVSGAELLADDSTTGQFEAAVDAVLAGIA